MSLVTLLSTYLWPCLSVVIGQADIDAFVHSAKNDMLTPEGVMSAVVTKGIPVNGQHSTWCRTALHWAVFRQRREVVVALLAVGADANIKNKYGETSVKWGASFGTANILQLLIDGGGCVNEPDIYGRTPLIEVVRWHGREAAARLQVLLACPESDLDAKHDGLTAEECAMACVRPEVAFVIAQERARRERWNALRERWSALRAAWIGATIASTVAFSII
jgi:hypothetical protein